MADIIVVFIFIVLVLYVFESSKAKSESEIIQKIDFYNCCSKELKKWSDLRDSHALTEEEYQEKKEKGQYVNKALSSISSVINLIYDTDNVEIYNHAEKKINDRYSIKFIAEPKYKGKFHEYYFESPQNMLKAWSSLRDSNAITEEEYQKLKEEFLSEEGVHENAVVTEELKAWSSLRDSNAITEEEFQKLKVYLLDSDL